MVSRCRPQMSRITFPWAQVAATRMGHVQAYNFTSDPVCSEVLSVSTPCISASLRISRGDGSAICFFDDGLDGLWRIDRLSSVDSLDIGYSKRIIDARCCQGFDKRWTMALVQCRDGVFLKVWNAPECSASSEHLRQPHLIVRLPCISKAMSFISLDQHTLVAHETGWGEPLATIACCEIDAGTLNEACAFNRSCPTLQRYSQTESFL